MKKTIFSSNLVESVGSEGSDQTTTVVLSRNFWKFILSSVCLMIATLLLAIGWRFGWRRLWPVLRRKLKRAASEI
jgi:hypothetical protein